MCGRLFLVFFVRFCYHRDLHVLTHALPTRRSSDVHTYSAAAEAGGRRHGYREDEIKADGRVRGTAAVVQDIACGQDGVRLIARNGPVDVSAAPFLLHMDDAHRTLQRTDRIAPLRSAAGGQDEGGGQQPTSGPALFVT